ncbi:MAG: uracil-DNA glycosylase [Magnetococcus sp. MYC-9]
MEHTEREAWRATLGYWLACGWEFRSGSRLEFDASPPRARVGQRGVGVSVTPTLPIPAIASPGHGPVEVDVNRAIPKPPSLPPVVASELPWPAPVPGSERPALLAAMATDVAGCSRCSLAHTRTRTVFGVGNPNARVVFVGEGPGAEEDAQGEPFVGAAGKLLDQMVRAIGLQRADVYIANVVKCRPPGNRNPQAEEVAACQEYLFRQLAIIRPQILFCLGKFAILCLTGHADAVGKARGRPFSWRGIPVIASFHPAYYLRTPLRKRAAWEDLLRLMKQLRALESQGAENHAETPPPV